MRELRVLKTNSPDINILTKFEIAHSPKCILNIDYSEVEKLE